MNLLAMWRSSRSHSTTFELRTFSACPKFAQCFKFMPLCRTKIHGKMLLLRVTSYAESKHLQKQLQKSANKSFPVTMQLSSITHVCSQRNAAHFRFWPFIGHNAAGAYFRFRRFQRSRLELSAGRTPRVSSLTGATFARHLKTHLFSCLN